MNFNQLLKDDRAVSPVIGVILMVAITVILAAVIGSFVLGLGNSVQQTAPNANFDISFDAGGDGSFGTSDGNDQATVTHTGGDTIADARLEVVVDDEATNFGSEVSAGTSVTVQDGDDFDGDADTVDFESGDALQLIWTSDDGSSSQTLAEQETP